MMNFATHHFQRLFPGACTRQLIGAVLFLFFSSGCSATRQAVPTPYTTERSPSGKIEVRNVFMELSEVKPTEKLELFSSQSRLLTVKNQIIRTSVGDAAICEPVVVAEHEIVVLGKATGTTTLDLWDSKGGVASLEVTVKRSGPIGTVIDGVTDHFRVVKLVDQIPSAKVERLALTEIKPSEHVELKAGESKLFRVPKGRINRTSCSNQAVASVVTIADDAFYIVGKTQGQASVFVWNIYHEVSGFEVQVKPGGTAVRKVVSQERRIPELPTSGFTVESWSGDQKFISVSRPNVFGPSDFKVNELDAIDMNNKGVGALRRGKYPSAIEEFISSLFLDSTYMLAKENLAVAYNNYGLSIAETPKEAIRQFHHSRYLNPDNRITEANLQKFSAKLGKDYQKFEDRVELGDRASNSEDYDGAIIEYQGALRIHERLDLVTKIDQAQEALAGKDYRYWLR